MSEKAIDSQITPPNPDLTNNWYLVPGLPGERDVFVAAARAADTTGQVQQVHRHPEVVSCEGRQHTLVEPDPTRSTAIRED